MLDRNTSVEIEKIFFKKSWALKDRYVKCKQKKRKKGSKKGYKLCTSLAYP